MFPAPGRTMLRNPQRTFLVDKLAPIVHNDVNKLRTLYGTAVREGRWLTPAEYDRATEITNDLHREYQYHYFMNFVPPPDLKALIDRYYRGDGQKQWGLHMGRRAVTEARVAWSRKQANEQAEAEAEAMDTWEEPRLVDLTASDDKDDDGEGSGRVLNDDDYGHKPVQQKKGRLNRELRGLAEHNTSGPKWDKSQ